MYLFQVKLEQPRKGGKSYLQPTFHYTIDARGENVLAHWQGIFPTYRVTVRKATVGMVTGDQTLHHLVLKVEAAQ